MMLERIVKVPWRPDLEDFFGDDVSMVKFARILVRIVGGDSVARTKDCQSYSVSVD